MNNNIKFIVESFFDTEEEIESDILLKLPKFVDLGLPSGTIWCKCNVGADTEIDYGDYFMWASTKPNNCDICSWVDHNLPYQTVKTYTYKHTKWSKYLGSTTSKYKVHNASDKDALKIELELEDDASHVNTIGGICIIPTLEQLQELVKYTNNEWVDNFNSSGINGRIFKSKVNDNYIFIPAAGYRTNGTFYLQDSGGFVWSSRVNSSEPCGAYSMTFDSSLINGSATGYGRCNAFSIRGVLNLK